MEKLKVYSCLARKKDASTGSDFFNTVFIDPDIYLNGTDWMTRRGRKITVDLSKTSGFKLMLACIYSRLSFAPAVFAG